MDYKVVEKFVSIDGEGIRTGFPVIFLRFAGCNLKCSYCDSLYANENPKYEIMNENQIIRYCNQTGFKKITVTGGEPLIAPSMYDLIDKLEELNYDVNIETNGSIDISDCNERTLITMDWKSISSGVSEKMRPGNIEFLGTKDVLKFVVGSQADLEQMKLVINKYQPRCHVFVSPVFGKIELVDIVNFILENKMQNVRMQLQIHKIIWDQNKRGV